MSLNAIVAVDGRLGIGANNEMPWPRNRADMRWFREHTEGGVVVMGRRTWESIGSKNLPNRINAVVTSGEMSNPVPRGDDTVERPHWILAGDMKDVLWDLERMYFGKNIWVIGGGEVYRQALQYVDNLYLTTIPGKFDCDVFLDKREVDKFRHVIYKDIADDGTTFEIRGKF